MSKKEKKKLKVNFIGKNAYDVTGSSVLIETDDYNILIEYGLHQGNSVSKEYKINVQKPKGLSIKKIDYIFINHLHTDHVGNIPFLYKHGCQAKIIAPKGSRAILEALLKDSAHIMFKDSELLTKQLNRNIDPIYAEIDVNNALKHLIEYETEEKIRINNDIEFCYQPSGHIINSYSLELWITQGNIVKKIVYTSDLGNISVPQFYTNNFKPIKQANLVIGEATYAKKEKKITKKDRIKDTEKIKSVIEQFCGDLKGKVLFPTFSLHRTQTMITVLYDIFKKDENFKTKIIIASPLANTLCDIFINELKGEQRKQFEEVMNWKNVIQVREFQDLEYYLNLDEPMIFLASAGFCQAGYSKAICASLLPHSNNCIVVCGYAMPDTLIWKIKNGTNKYLSIDGIVYKNKCSCVCLKSFSSHMNHDDLLKYYSDFQAEKICIVHSEMNEKIKFCKELQDEISKKNHSSRVICVNKDTSINL